MAETLDFGPDGNTANPQWVYWISCPPRHFISLNFQFHALWSNMIWICSGVTHEKLEVRNNNGNEGEFVSGINATNNVTFPLAIVAYHKLVSWTVDHPERFPWRQSPMAVLRWDVFPNPSWGHSFAQVGFSDEGGPGFNQAVCNVLRVGPAA
jgi:hypothetical protein